MTNITVIENKISAVKKYLGILGSYQDSTANDLKNDKTLKGAVERYLYLAVQAAIDLAEAVIAFKGLRKPSTYGETFAILVDDGFLPSELALSLSRMAGFRNILAHDYEDVDLQIVVDILHTKLNDIDEFLKITRGKMLIR